MNKNNKRFKTLFLLPKTNQKILSKVLKILTYEINKSKTLIKTEGHIKDNTAERKQMRVISIWERVKINCK